MAEYKKKVSGVTNVLIRDAHGKRKIDHETWNNELRDAAADHTQGNHRKSKKSHSHITALYICFIVAWIIVFVPIPILSYIIAFPLLFAGLILSIICLAKDNFKHGITGLFLFFVVSPIISLIGLGFLFSALTHNTNHRDIADIFKKTGPQAISTSLPRIIEPKVTEKRIEPKTPKNVAKPQQTKPVITYKYIITLKNGRNFVADELSINKNIATYKDGSMRVSMSTDEIASYKKVYSKL